MVFGKVKIKLVELVKPVVRGVMLILRRIYICTFIHLYILVILVIAKVYCLKAVFEVFEVSKVFVV